MGVKVMEGDCLELLPTLADGSVDAIVTDPPYGLEFMGKEWDCFDNAARRVRGTGGSQAPFANHAVPLTPTRNRSFGEWCSRWIVEVLRVLKPGGYLLSFGGTRTHHRLACAVEDAGFEIRDCIMWLYGQGFPKGHQLKPAYEPIVLARRPGPRVLPLGIDECRIPCDGDNPSIERRKGRPGGRPGEYGSTIVNRITPERFAEERPGELLGRYPANVLHDGSDEVLEAFAAFGEKTSGGRPGAIYDRVSGGNCYGEGKTWGGAGSHADAGTAARFFYCAKASKAERGEGNTHPTVKPVELMRWLVRLVTPLGGTILDPFAGSGTTGLAALAEGRNAILIEKNPDYVQIIRDRLAAERARYPLFAATEPVE